MSFEKQQIRQVADVLNRTTPTEFRFVGLDGVETSEYFYNASDLVQAFCQLFAVANQYVVGVWQVETDFDAEDFVRRVAKKGD